MSPTNRGQSSTSTIQPSHRKRRGAVPKPTPRRTSVSKKLPLPPAAFQLPRGWGQSLESMEQDLSLVSPQLSTKSTYIRFRPYRLTPRTQQRDEEQGDAVPATPAIEPLAHTPTHDASVQHMQHLPTPENSQASPIHRTIQQPDQRLQVTESSPAPTSSALSNHNQTTTDEEQLTNESQPASTSPTANVEALSLMQNSFTQSLTQLHEQYMEPMRTLAGELNTLRLQVSTLMQENLRLRSQRRQ